MPHPARAIPARTIPSGPAVLECAARVSPPPEDGGPRRFAGVAYSGGVIPDFYRDGDAAIDVGSVRLNERDFVLLGHQHDRPVGVARLRVEAGQILAEGELFSAGQDGPLIAAYADQGAPWMLSVGLYDFTIDTAPEPRPVRLNDRTLAVRTVYRNAHVREVSFVPLGADPSAAAAVLSAPPPTPEDPPMDEIAALQAELDAERVARRALEEQLETLTREAAEQARSARLAAVKSLYETLGREDYTPEAAKPYLELSAEAFAAVSQDLQRARPPLDPSLKHELAAGDAPTTGTTRTSTAIYESRRRRAVN